MLGPQKQTTLNQILERLEQLHILSEGVLTPPDDHAQPLSQVISIIGYLQQTVELAVTDAWPLNQMNQFVSLMSNALQHMKVYRDNNAVQYLHQVISTLEDAVTKAVQIPLQRGQSEVDNAKALLKVQALGEDQIRGFEKRSALVEEALSSLEADLATLTSAVEGEQAKVANVTAQYQSQFSNAQETRAKDFAAAEKERSSEYAKVVNEIEADRNRRDKDFSDLLGDAKQKYLDVVELLRQEYDVPAKDILQTIANTKTEVETLVGVIGNVGITSGYSKTANAAAFAATSWRFAAIACLAGIFLVAFYELGAALKPDATQTITMAFVLARIVLVSPLIVLAAYCGAQADRNSRIDHQNRKLALELEAIGPYLTPLAKDKQDEFRVKLGERTFGREPTAQSSELKKSPTTILDVANLKEFPDWLAKLKEVLLK